MLLLIGKKYSPKTLTHVSSATEYVLVYAKNLEHAETGKLEHTDEQKTRFQNPDNDPNGPWKSVDPQSQELIIKTYATQSPFTGKLIYSTKNTHWSKGKSTMK